MYPERMLGTLGTLWEISPGRARMTLKIQPQKLLIFRCILKLALKLLSIVTRAMKLDSRHSECGRALVLSRYIKHWSTTWLCAEPLVVLPLHTRLQNHPQVQYHHHHNHQSFRLHHHVRTDLKLRVSLQKGSQQPGSQLQENQRTACGSSEIQTQCSP